MNDFQFDIDSAKKQQQGVSGFVIEDKPVYQPIDVPLTGIEITGEIDTYTALSLLGTPIYETIKFKHAEDRETKELTLGKTPDKDTFFDVPVMNVSRSKTIVKTPVSGKKGSAKELFGFEDYKITIQGILINPDNHTTPPYDLMKALSEFDDIEDAIEVESRYLQALNVNSICIEDISYNRVQNMPGMVVYNISAVSDEPFELEYNDTKTKLLNA